MRPLNLVDVLEQLPADVVGTMVVGQLGGDDIRSFKLVAPSTLALVRRTSRVLRLNTEQTLSQLDLESQVKILAKYEACMELQLDLQSPAGIAPLLVGVARSLLALLCPRVTISLLPDFKLELIESHS